MHLQLDLSEACLTLLWYWQLPALKISHQNCSPKQPRPKFWQLVIWTQSHVKYVNRVWITLSHSPLQTVTLAPNGKRVTHTLTAQWRRCVNRGERTDCQVCDGFIGYVRSQFNQLAIGWKGRYTVAYLFQNVKSLKFTSVFSLPNVTYNTQYIQYPCLTTGLGHMMKWGNRGLGYCQRWIG